MMVSVQSVCSGGDHHEHHNFLAAALVRLSVSKLLNPRLGADAVSLDQDVLGRLVDGRVRALQSDYEDARASPDVRPALQRSPRPYHSGLSGLCSCGSFLPSSRPACTHRSMWRCCMNWSSAYFSEPHGVSVCVLRHMQPGTTVQGYQALQGLQMRSDTL